MQLPQKDTFHILATIRIHNACTHPMRNFGSELGTACWLAQLLESREEPASNDQWGFDGLLSLSVLSALTGGVGITTSHIQKQRALQTGEGSGFAWV